MPFICIIAVLFLSVLPGGVLARYVPLDDEAIFVAVEEALHRAHALAAARITVHTRDGFVTLGGSVATQKDIATAVRLASGVRGVTGVSNEIRVAERAWRG